MDVVERKAQTASAKVLATGGNKSGLPCPDPEQSDDRAAMGSSLIGHMHRH